MIKIEASKRIRAYKKLMARNTQVSRAAETGIKEIMNKLVCKGYEAKTTHVRALYDIVFFNPETEHKLTLVGWHGIGRYGPEKTVLELYDENEGKKPVVSFGVINDDNLNVDRQKFVIEAILEYIKRF